MVTAATTVVASMTNGVARRLTLIGSVLSEPHRTVSDGEDNVRRIDPDVVDRQM